MFATQKLLDAELFRRFNTIIKDINEIGLFTVMANRPWFLAFSATPFFFIVMPLLALVFTGYSLMDLYKLYRSHNRNFEQWGSAIVSTLVAISTSVSLYGAVIATLVGGSFAAGPFFFVGSLSLGFVWYGALLGLDIYRAYQAPGKSEVRIEHIKSAFSRAYTLAVIAAVTGTAVFVLIAPVAPPVAAAFAILAVSLTAAHLLVPFAWWLVPNRPKAWIKTTLGLEAPDLPEEQKLDIQLTKVKASSPLFASGIDPVSTIKSLRDNHKIAYLIRLIDLKINQLKGPDVLNKDSDVLNIEPKEASQNSKSGKIQAKIELLEYLKNRLNNTNFHTEDLESCIKPFKAKGAFSSFFRTKGDVERIYEACQLVLWQNNGDAKQSLTVDEHQQDRVRVCSLGLSSFCD